MSGEGLIGNTGLNLADVLFDSQPDSVIWFTPLFEDGVSNVPTDFVVEYCNASACTALRTTRQNLIGSCVSKSAVLDELTRKQIITQYIHVWQTGKSIDFTFYSPEVDKYFYIQRSKINNGILSITRDQTLLEQTRKEKEIQADLITQLIENSPYGISLYETMRDESGNIKDFRLRLCNQKTAEITGFTFEELKKYTAKELMVIRGNDRFFDIVSGVVTTGITQIIDYYASTRNLWLSLSIMKHNDGYLLHYVDITKTKLLEKQALQQAELLTGVLDASLTGLVSLEVINGFSGKMLDLKFTLFNKTAETILSIKPEDKSKTYLTLFPAAKSNGMFDLFNKVIETGEPVKTKFYYKGDGFDGWFALSISKMGNNGLVQSFSEIEEPTLIND